MHEACLKEGSRNPPETIPIFLSNRGLIDDQRLVSGFGSNLAPPQPSWKKKCKFWSQLHGCRGRQSDRWARVGTPLWVPAIRPNLVSHLWERSMGHALELPFQLLRTFWKEPGTSDSGRQTDFEVAPASPAQPHRGPQNRHLSCTRFRGPLMLFVRAVPKKGTKIGARSGHQKVPS